MTKLPSDPFQQLLKLYSVVPKEWILNERDLIPFSEKRGHRLVLLLLYRRLIMKKFNRKIAFSMLCDHIRCDLVADGRDDATHC